MTDVFTPAKRSAIMASVRGQNTKPEILVRKLVHSLGYRFRLHQKQFPGKPDLVLPRHEKIIFIHGCFWHGHRGCSRAALPSTNTEFWQKKIGANRSRDIKVTRKLGLTGWRVQVIWQCQTKDVAKLKQRLLQFLES
jgi:DNA mismatch endonuclease, patch repair protein